MTYREVRDELRRLRDVLKAAKTNDPSARLCLQSAYSRVERAAEMIENAALVQGRGTIDMEV